MLERKQRNNVSCNTIRRDSESLPFLR